MLMERENAAGLLQLKLRSADANDVTVEIGMPEVDWSMDEFDGIEVQLGDAGFATRIGGGEAVARYDVSCGHPRRVKRAQ